MSRILAPLLVVLAAFGACRADTVAGSSQSVTDRQAPSGLDLIPLTIHSDGRTHRFTVEVARTAGEQARGLMFRESLDPDAGMLFPMSPPRPASFWMKNTLIPLDMLFIRPDGAIARIAANTTPHALDPVTSFGEPVIAVLELRGGRAAELGIEEGDRVSWSPGDAPPIMR